MRAIALVIFALLVSPAALAVEPADCQDATDRLRRAARDAADAADALDARSARRGELGAVHSELADVEGRLARAKADCGLSRVSALNPVSVDTALKQIRAWEAHMSKTDPNFARVQARLMELVQGPIRTLPPEHWVTALQLMYLAASQR